jgi:hypothetical protein
MGDAERDLGIVEGTLGLALLLFFFHFPSTLLNFDIVLSYKREQRSKRKDLHGRMRRFLIPLRVLLFV